MQILLTGANGYIGTRVLPVLLEERHKVSCLVRDKRRFNEENAQSDNVTVVEGDLLKPETLEFPPETEVAYYLVHSMSTGGKFDELEAESATNFVEAIKKTTCHQIIFLT